VLVQHTNPTRDPKDHKGTDLEKKHRDSRHGTRFRRKWLGRPHAGTRKRRSTADCHAVRPLRDDNSAARRASDDPGILRSAVQHNQGRVGAYAHVVRGGQVRRGNQVWLE